jgi:hypothetical protein
MAPLLSGSRRRPGGIAVRLTFLALALAGDGNGLVSRRTARLGRSVHPNERGEHHDVVGVVAGLFVELAAERDQPEVGVVEIAVDGIGREGVLRETSMWSTQNVALLPSWRATRISSPGLSQLLD